MHVIMCMGLPLRLAFLPGVVLLGSVPGVQAINIACVGDSITYGHPYYAASDRSKCYPSQLQALFNTRDGAGTYTVGNYGISGLTLRNDGNTPYTANAIYPASLASNPDIVVIMLGANDAKVGINWNVAAKDGTNTSINIFNDDFTALIDSYRTLPSAPRILVCTPIPACSVGTGNYFSIDGTVIDDELCPFIRTSLTAPADVGLIELNAVFPDEQPAYYAPDDMIHPNETGYAFIAEKIYGIVRTTLEPDWNTSPGDGTVGVTNSAISWSPDPAAIAYQVYIGTNAAAVTSATPTDPEYKASTDALQYSPGLDSQVEYFWRVDAVTVLATNTGPVRSFTTGILPGADRRISISVGSDDVIVSVPFSRTGTHYQLQYRPDLMDGVWTNEGASLLGTGDDLNLMHTQGATNLTQYYRVELP